jgi:hypothetical protein
MTLEIWVFRQFFIGGVSGMVLFHQIVLITISIVNTIATLYSFQFIDWTDENMVITNGILAALSVYHIFLSILLLLGALMGLLEPTEWFPMLSSFQGSGLWIVFLGIFTMHQIKGFIGLGLAGLCIIPGVFFIFYGLLWRERGCNNYRRLVY